jgi:hypothetical protein
LLLDLLAETPPRPAAVATVRDVVHQAEARGRAGARRQQEAAGEKGRAYQKWALGMIRMLDDTTGWDDEATLPWVLGHLRAFKAAEADVDWELFTLFPSTQDLIQERRGADLSGTRGARLTADQQKDVHQRAAGGVRNVIHWAGNIDQEIAYRVTRDAMVQYLLPVNPALLDPPVAQLYHRAFQKGRARLEGRPDQLFVAEQSAVVTKRGLD